MSQTSHKDKFMLRLPAGMRDRIGRAAKTSKRSMNTEIVHRLETSFKADAEKDVPDFVTPHMFEQISEIHQMLTTLVKRKDPSEPQKIRTKA